MRDIRGLVRLACGAGAAAAGAAAYVLACGPFLTAMRPAETIRPAHLESYDQGRLGVVREHFARRFLVQAYRRFSGRPAIAVEPTAAAVTPFVPTAELAPIKAWRDLHKQITGTDPAVDTDRRIGDFQTIPNCLLDAYATAAKTGHARADKYGAASAQARDWVRAQDAVLANCSGTGLVLPDPAPAGADALTRADRAYQTAAANFYALKFDEAARLFQGIAADTTSPWRPYGHYLAGRAMIRQATIPEKLDRQKMVSARAEFQATLADRDAALLHESAKGLLNLVAFRIEPAQLLRDMSATIGGADTVTPQQLADYERVMDALLGDTTSFAYGTLAERDAIAGTAELNDWITVMQGSGDEAAARAVAQWKRTSGAPWLVAALWKIPANHPDAQGLLAAAARADASSPAFFTLAFLRVRR